MAGAGGGKGARENVRPSFLYAGGCIERERERERGRVCVRESERESDRECVCQ